MNVFTYCYMPWKYPKNWLKNFGQFFRGFKWAYQRAIYGFCDFDLWSLDRFYLRLFNETLKEFQIGLHGAPQEFYDEENDSVQPWIDYLEEMRVHFYNALEENNAQENEYWSELFEKELKNNPPWFNNQNRSELEEKWFKREMDIEVWRDEEFHKGWKMMEKVFFNLWD